MSNEVATVENLEVLDVAEELVPEVKWPTSLKVAAGIGLTAGVGYGLYRLGKFIYAKAKAKKELKQAQAEAQYEPEEDCDYDVE